MTESVITPGERIMTLEAQYQALVNERVPLENRAMHAALNAVPGNVIRINDLDPARTRPLSDEEKVRLVEIRRQEDDIVRQIDALKKGEA